MMRHSITFTLLSCMLLVFFADTAVYGVGAYYTDVPHYNQAWFTGSGDCLPNSAAQVLGWHDAHGWPAMIPNGYNEYAENPNGVTITMDTVKDAVGFEDGGYVMFALLDTLSSDVADAVHTLDSGASWWTDDDDITSWSDMKGQIYNYSPMMFIVKADSSTLYAYYGSFSNGSVSDSDGLNTSTQGHSMCMYGYSEDVYKVNANARWMILDTGWGRTEPAWVNYDSSGFDFYTCEFRAQGTPSADDDLYEENDTRVTAYDFSGDERSWLSTISGLGLQSDEDWYEIYVTPGYEKVLIDCQFTDSDGDIDIQLVNASGTVQDGSYSTSDDEYVDYVVPSAGTYYIRVYFGNAGNTYDLWWDDVQEASSEPNLSYHSHRIDDDMSTSSGNDDGIVNPGETIELPVTLQNTGSADAHNVAAILSTSDSYVTITDNDRTWGDIPSGTTDESSDFDFEVSSSCPDGHVITFNLAISSDEGSWSDSFTVPVEAVPDLAYYSHTIDDDMTTSSGNDDGQVNPGETIELPVTLENIGSADAHNVEAILSTSDSYVTITDNDRTWGDIPSGTTDESSDFDFEVSSSCPGGHVITFNLAISSDEGSWSDSFSVTVYAIQTYSLIVNNGSGDGSYASGTVVPIVADAPPSGQEFDVWTGDTAYVADVNASSTTVTMPSGSVTVTATYKSLPPDSYTLTVNNGSGDGTYPNGQQVVITADPPSSNQVFNAWTGDTAYIANVNASTTTLTMPAENVSVTATYRISGGGDTAFFEDWESGEIKTNKWKAWGVPAPTIVSGGNSIGAYALTSNGDANYDSGVTSLQRFEVRPGLYVSAEMYIQAPGTDVWSKRSWQGIQLSTRVPEEWDNSKGWSDSTIGPAISIRGNTPLDTGLGISIPGGGTNYSSAAWVDRWTEVGFVFNEDGSVTYLIEGEVLYTTAAGWIDYASAPEVSLVCGGRSEGSSVTNLHDNIQIFYSEFFEDWESSVISTNKWKIWGSPAPTIVSGGNSIGAYALTSNGDANYDSGVTSLQSFEVKPGLTASAKLFIQAPGTDVWSKRSWQGIQLSSRPPAEWDNSKGWSDSTVGPAISIRGNTPLDTGLGISIPGGGTNYSSAAWVDRWTDLAFRFNWDGSVTYYVDGDALYTTEAGWIDYDSAPEVYMVCGGRSEGSSVTNLHDNIQIYTEISAINDSDHDGQTDGAEAVAGTNPYNPTSYFGITNYGASASFALEWSPCVTGRWYSVMWTPSLTNSFQTLEDFIEHPQNSYTDTVYDAEPTGFYKVEVRMK